MDRYWLVTIGINEEAFMSRGPYLRARTMPYKGEHPMELLKEADLSYSLLFFSEITERQYNEHIEWQDKHFTT